MNRYRFVAAVLTAVLVSSVPAVSAQTPQVAQAQERASVAEGAGAKENEEMVCTRKRQSGSNRVTRLCRTAGEARIERKAAEESMRRKRSQPQRDERP